MDRKTTNCGIICGSIEPTEHNWAIKMNQLLMHAITQMNLKIILLSERKAFIIWFHVCVCRNTILENAIYKERKQMSASRWQWGRISREQDETWRWWICLLWWWLWWFHMYTYVKTYVKTYQVVLSKYILSPNKVVLKRWLWNYFTWGLHG